jgi:hypothetical protein
VLRFFDVAAARWIDYKSNAMEDFRRHTESVVVVAPSCSGKSFFVKGSPPWVIDFDSIAVYPAGEWWLDEKVMKSVNDANTERLKKRLAMNLGEVILCPYPFVKPDGYVIISQADYGERLRCAELERGSQHFLPRDFRAYYELALMAQQARVPTFKSFNDALSLRRESKVPALEKGITRVTGITVERDRKFYDVSGHLMHMILLACSGVVSIHDYMSAIEGNVTLYHSFGRRRAWLMKDSVLAEGAFRGLWHSRSDWLIAVYGAWSITHDLGIDRGDISFQSIINRILHIYDNEDGLGQGVVGFLKTETLALRQ